MKSRKLLLAFLSVLALGGASVGAALAAPYLPSPQGQSSQGDDPEATAAETAHAPDPKAYLGLAVRPLTERVREELGLPEDLEGTVVAKAQRNSPAAEAGIEHADVITSAGEVPVTGPRALMEVVRSHDPGDVVAITYYRDGASHTVDVTLAERPHRNGGPDSQGVNPLRRFLNILPNAVDGSFRVLGDDGTIRVHEVAQGSITEAGDGSLTIEKATGESATFAISEDTLIVKQGRKTDASSLEEGTRAVVLSVDGDVKAVMLVGQLQRQRPSAGNRPGLRIERLEQHFQQLRERLNLMHPRIERIEQRFGQLQDRFGQLRERMNRLLPHVDEPVDEQGADPVVLPADATAA